MHVTTETGKNAPSVPSAEQETRIAEIRKQINPETHGKSLAQFDQALSGLRGLVDIAAEATIPGGLSDRFTYRTKALAHALKSAGITSAEENAKEITKIFADLAGIELAKTDLASMFPEPNRKSRKPSSPSK